MKKDDIRTLIVIVIVFVICLALVLLLSKKKNSDELENVKEYNTFFAVTNCINEYLNIFSSGDEESIHNLLASEYIEKNNNYDDIDSYPRNVTAKINNIKTVKIGDNNLYYANGKVIQSNFDKANIIDDNFSIIVLIDYNNITFSIYPIFNNNYERIINSIKKINIERNDNNSLKDNRIINKEQICVLYMSDYVDKINNDVDSAYELLSVKMKERYPSIDSYQSYINSNKYRFTTVADKCRVTEGKDNTRTYYVVDGNENEYTFYEDGIMNYTVEYYLK